MKKCLILLLCMLLLLTSCAVSPELPSGTESSDTASEENPESSTPTDTTDKTAFETAIPSPSEEGTNAAGDASDPTSEETEALPSDTAEESAQSEAIEKESDGSQATEPEFSSEEIGTGEDSPEDFEIPACQTYWYFDYVEGAEKLARVSHADGKIYLIEKFPLCYYKDENLVASFPTATHPYLSCNRVFGSVSDRYFFKYDGDAIESVTHFYTTEDHFGNATAEKGYVRKFEKAELSDTYSVEFYFRGIRVPAAENIVLDRFGDGGYTRSVYADLNSSYRTDVQYDESGRPTLISGNTSPSSAYYMEYDGNGNVKYARKSPAGEGNYDAQEEYFFTFEDGRLAAMEYKNYEQYGAGQYQAQLRYDAAGKFIAADVKGEYAEGSVEVSYDADGRVTGYQMPDFNQGTHVLVRIFQYNGDGLYSSVRTQALEWYNGEITENVLLDATVNMTYTENGRIATLSYPDSVLSPNVQTLTTEFSYNADGKLVGDGAYEYTYAADGSLAKKTKKDGSGYVAYYGNGMIKEQSYVRQGFDNDYNRIDYLITDYFEPSDIYYTVTDATSAYGSPYAERSVSVAENGTRYETTRIFDEFHVMTDFQTVMYDAEGNVIEE